MTVFPVEREIFLMNVSLSENVGSRIDVDELRMLSSDVWDLVSMYEDET